MLYAVSFSNGVLGVFSSMDKVKEHVLEQYTHISFIIQVYNIDESCSSEIVWVILYKDSDNIALVTNNKERAESTKKILNKVGKSYDEDITYWELKIDTIASAIEPIVTHLDNAYKETSPIGIDSSDSIIYYTQ